MSALFAEVALACRTNSSIADNRVGDIDKKW